MGSITQVQIHLHSSKGPPFITGRDYLYNVRISAKQNKIIVPVQVTDQDQKQVTLKVLRGYECLKVKSEENNEVFQESDFFIYSTSTSDVSTLWFTVDVFTKVAVDSTPTHLGVGHISPSQISGSSGTLKVTLIDKTFQACGTIAVDYLLVKPWNHTLNTPSQQNRRSRGLTGQKKHGQSYMCGHRGAGESFGTQMPSKFPENTISAFKAGHEMGMDFVEMDVQVSTDHVPVIFHDTSVKLCLEALPLLPSEKPKSIACEIPVKDLTAEQLRTAKVWEWSEIVANQKAQNRGHGNVVDGNSKSISSATDISNDYKLFPTLEEALVEVPQETGFLIELKYPFKEMIDEDIDYLCMDKNQFVDSILQAVFERAEERRVLLASFDPDICTMCQFKQSKYPVLLITQGNTTIWDPYEDIRARSTAMAVAFTKSQNLDGVHIFSSLLFDATDEIEKILKSDLTLSVWGPANDDPEKKSWLVQHGVQCVQIDNIFGSA